ncbi:hypothetical protein PR048_008986 [Dryococelus australis]|uniref:Uncharacterized protein n=1 Tax=Dryococelus australis TaxID=614101 RepID=A0ABQ9HYM1_9NEOP|nr:hypothetical protein PR048_008986 [Dryococelus australis]
MLIAAMCVLCLSPNYYASVLDAVYLDNVTVLGHSTWALIDTFEWDTYSNKFGMYRVNFTDPEKARTVRESSKVLATIIKTRKLPEEYLNKE